MSEALILASTIPQYDRILLIELPVQCEKTTCSEHVVCTILLSYCGLVVDARISGSDKDLPVRMS